MSAGAPPCLAWPRSHKLSSNESPLGPSPKALAALDEAKASLSLYPEGSARLLREAIARILRPGSGAHRSVAATAPTRFLTMLANAYLRPDDEVMFGQHAFLVYKIATLANSARPVIVPEKDTNSGIKLEVDALLGGGDAKDAHGLSRQSQQSHRHLPQPRRDGAAACRAAGKCAAGDRRGLCRICHRQGLRGGA